MKKHKLKTDVKGVDPDAVHHPHPIKNDHKSGTENTKQPPKMSASEVAKRSRIGIYSRNGHGGYQGL